MLNVLYGGGMTPTIDNFIPEAGVASSTLPEFYIEPNCDNDFYFICVVLDSENDYHLLDPDCRPIVCKMLHTAAQEPTEINSNSPVCMGSALELSVTGGVSWNWSGPSGFSSILSEVNIENAQLENAGLYSVEILSSNGCIQTFEVSVGVNSDENFSMDFPTGACDGEEVLLQAPENVPVLWTGPNGFSSDENTLLIESITMDNAGIYSLELLTESCNGFYEFELEVFPMPFPTIDYNGPVCPGEPIEFSGSGGVGMGGHSWEGPNGWTNDVSSPVIDPASPANAGIYTLTVTSNYGCTASETITVEVITAPEIMLSNSQTVCQGEDFELTTAEGEYYVC